MPESGDLTEHGATDSFDLRPWQVLALTAAIIVAGTALLIAIQVWLL